LLLHAEKTSMPINIVAIRAITTIFFILIPPLSEILFLGLTFF